MELYERREKKGPSLLRLKEDSPKKRTNRKERQHFCTSSWVSTISPLHYARREHRKKEEYKETNETAERGARMRENIRDGTGGVWEVHVFYCFPLQIALLSPQLVLIPPRGL
mmetsp:Transcript_17267/g.35054  ORF Transcript_17267/g.35054 Transcript_17267/m.35054 type:complete len:112 (-) Transcript_17267:6-341(-)